MLNLNDLNIITQITVGYFLNEDNIKDTILQVCCIDKLTKERKILYIVRDGFDHSERLSKTKPCVNTRV